MRKKILFAAVLVMLLNELTSAQNQPINLSDYKLPNLKRKVLETRFNLSNYYQFQKNDLNPYYKEETSKSSYGSIEANYYSLLNTPKIQRNTYLGFGSSVNFYSRKYDSGTLKEYNYSPQVIYNLKNRFYNGMNFLETDVDARLSFEKDHRDDQSSANMDFNYTNTYLYASLPLKIGKGRIEEIQDARHAVYILDELGKQNRVTSGRTKEEVLELATFISELKNKRFFDSREREIYEIEAIDSFLKAKDYIISSDARYFTTLTDFWAYGDLVTRRSGTRIAAAVAPGVYYNKLKNTRSNYLEDRTQQSFYLAGGIEFLHEKPINLSWQNTIKINAFYSVLKGKEKWEDNPDSYKLNVPRVQFDFSQSFGYYPNTRTSVVFGYSAAYAEIFDKKDDTKKISGAVNKGFNVSANVNVNYYLSRKVRLNVAAAIYGIWEDSKYFNPLNFGNYIGNVSANFNEYNHEGDYIEKNIGTYMNVTLVYSIF